MLEYLKSEGFVPNTIEITRGYDTWCGERFATQYRFYFENGYCASVINSSSSYGGRDGLWELAVLKKDDITGRYKINYKTYITDDVLGYLTK